MILNFVIPIISFLGFPIGIFLAFVSPEEMSDGKKYFFLLQNFILVLIIFFLFDFHNLNIFLSIFLTISIFLFVLYSSFKHKIFSLYMLLAFFLAFSRVDDYLFAIVASLIFIFGLPTGSLLAPKKKKFVLSVIMKFSLFIPLAILLLFLF
jgi:hypothetical protein